MFAQFSTGLQKQPEGWLTQHDVLCLRCALFLTDAETVVLVGTLLSIVAMLYSSVGHGGASGYIAILALVGIAPEIIRPTALCMNIVVAGLATVQFARSDLVHWRTAVPILTFSVPCAFLGGTLSLGSEAYRLLLGVLLVLSALYLIWQSTRRSDAFEDTRKRVPMVSSVATGSGIGFISGLSGIGGGVLLSPVFLMMGWAGARQTAGIAAVFILANSMAGLAGNLVTLKSLPAETGIWAGMAFMGSLIGTSLGIRTLPVKPLIWLLSAAVMISGMKFLML